VVLRRLPVLPCAAATDYRISPSWEELDNGSSWYFSWALRTSFFSFQTWGGKLTAPRYLTPSPYLGFCPTSRGKTWIKNRGRGSLFFKKMYALLFFPLVCRIQKLFQWSPSASMSLTMQACPFTSLSPYSVTLKQLSVDYVIIK